MSFFDTNPKGRIVNRFAKDIDYVDFSIPATFNSLLRQSFTIIGTIGIICVTNPVFIAIIIPIGVGYWLLQKVYVATSRQLRRMESATRSPIYSWFGEAISGIATIKAYGLQKRYMLKLAHHTVFFLGLWMRLSRRLMPTQPAWSQTIPPTDGSQSVSRCLETSSFSLPPSFVFWEGARSILGSSACPSPMLCRCPFLLYIAPS